MRKLVLMTALMLSSAFAGADAFASETIYFDNSVSNYSSVNIFYWEAGLEWPGVSMTQMEGDIWSYTFSTDASALKGVIFCNADGSMQSADYKDGVTDGHLYVLASSANKSQVKDMGLYDISVTRPKVTITPAGGRFTDSQLVTINVEPAGTPLFYTLDGSAPTAASSKYSAPFTVYDTTTVKAIAIDTDGNESRVAEAKFSKIAQIVPGDTKNLITDYYKVNPDERRGTNRTVSMSFSDQKSSTALSNWTEDDLIAQGVARDVAQTFKGHHERPIVDSYSIYAAYDKDNLYLGVQFVYLIWDLYGEGKQPGESKPYNMDGHMFWAFDLDPQASFDGLIDGKGPIWNENAQGAKFENGVDAILMCSTKPGVGVPGLFIPTPDGHASYSAAYCKSLPQNFYGYADGLLPSIEHIWGLESLDAEPEDLLGNDAFADLRGEIDDTAHTFYEFKIPLSTLGVTESDIKNYGIGVMYVDKYGTSPVGGTPYDPSYFDNVKDSYSLDKSSSKEKEDEDVITYAPARVGGSLFTTGVQTMQTSQDAETEYFTLDGIRVKAPSKGLYIQRRGSETRKIMLK